MEDKNISGFVKGATLTKQAVVNAKNLTISTKNSVEIANMIRNKKTARAKIMLEEVISLKKAVPYRRFDREVAHKTAIGPGKFPINACMEILRLIKGAEANAKNIGLNQNLYISSIIVNKGPMQWHPGRQKRRRMKNTHIQIILKEVNENKSRFVKGATLTAEKKVTKKWLKKKY